MNVLAQWGQKGPQIDGDTVQSTQSLVEYIHRWKKMEEDALAYSIEQAWNLVDGYTKFHAVHDAVHERWKKVLKLVQLGKGGNSLVEKCRGLRSSLMDDVMVLLLDSYEGVDELEGDEDFSREMLELREDGEIVDDDLSNEL